MATQGGEVAGAAQLEGSEGHLLLICFSQVAAAVLYLIPFRVVALLTGFYTLRHPRFRHKLPSPPLNFLRRLPARTDTML
ncbi:unnamed protein product [Spirodela intermedia]|uniref:Multiple C2 domain-containing protein n=1 Tax=Spirodela intermedia TaxID=51605 RepID=A0A7I8JJ42_SPIIN|nr:unnamed protein product [Spirodela intermedia]CAA6670186.1 unnamed protein product [Spirodela intermedia]